MSYTADHFSLFGGYVIGVLIFGLASAISSTPLFMCRICGYSEERLHRWIAFLPAIMLVIGILAGQFSNSWQGIIASDIAGAFGLAFSIDNLRCPSWYSRGIGVVFGFVFGGFSYFQIRDAWSFYQYALKSY